MREGRCVQHIRVAIVCPHDLERESLKSVLEARSLSVVEMAAAAEDLPLVDGRAEPPDLVIVAGLSSKSEAAQQIHASRARFPKSRTVLSTGPVSIDVVTEALRQGVDGVLLDDMSCDQMVMSLRLIALGERVIPSRLLTDLLDGRPPEPRPQVVTRSSDSGLSDRETEILHGLVAGDPNKVISRRLGISEATVKVHVKTILRKLNVTNRTQAAMWAVAQGVARMNGADDE
jgi:two-component system nitrate/nitrite response regulator NarL